MGDGETDGPGREQALSREEEQEVNAADFDIHVKAAQDIASLHADRMEGEPESPMDVLLDEFLAEQKKEQPDFLKLQVIRERMSREHPVVAAQSVTVETALQHMADRMETHDLDTKEQSVNRITKFYQQATGLRNDIQEMAESVTSELAEVYPPDINTIVNTTNRVVSDANVDLAKMLSCSTTELPSQLSDERQLLTLSAEDLNTMAATLHQLVLYTINKHTEMTDAVVTWRRNHHSV